MIENTFTKDILQGLTASPKYLQSKYFYDAKGDMLFQKIMQAPEYYLTDADMEIFEEQSDDISNVLSEDSNYFDVVELGAGDATKSTHLLQALLRGKKDFCYYPIDISENIIEQLEEEIPKRVPSVTVTGLAGEYLPMLEELNKMTTKKKVVLFLGSSIGNFETQNATSFLKALNAHLNKGDKLLIGFDLKKNPHQILAAYNDKEGITKDFNLNLLKRINDTSNADFDLDSFEHYPTYDPITGTCKSYLISTKDQKVSIDGQIIEFQKNEPIYMEMSQKYAESDIEELCRAAGFVNEHLFYDSNKWYCNTLWKKA